MSATMTGEALAGLRVELGMTQAELAQLLAVNASTLSRWEAAGVGALRADPATRRLLEALVEARRKAGAEQLARLLHPSLQTRGGLFALYQVLGVLFADVSQAR